MKAPKKFMNVIINDGKIQDMIIGEFRDILNHVQNDMSNKLENFYPKDKLEKFKEKSSTIEEFKNEMFEVSDNNNELGYNVNENGILFYFYSESPRPYYNDTYYKYQSIITPYETNQEFVKLPSLESKEISLNENDYFVFEIPKKLRNISQYQLISVYERDLIPPDIGDFTDLYQKAKALFLEEINEHYDDYIDEVNALFEKFENNDDQESIHETIDDDFGLHLTSDYVEYWFSGRNHFDIWIRKI